MTKRIFFINLAAFGIFLASDALANKNFESCAAHRDRCKLSWPADQCDKLYEYAMANGIWKSTYFDRRANQKVTVPVACFR